MRKIIFVASPEAASDESLARLDEAIRQIRERAETLFTRLAEDRLNEYLPPKRDEYEYQLVGTIDGTYSGRWMLAAFAENAAAVWPDGTAVYVRVKE